VRRSQAPSHEAFQRQAAFIWLKALDPIQDDMILVIGMSGCDDFLRQQAPMSERSRCVAVVIQAILRAALLATQKVVVGMAGHSDFRSTVGNSDCLDMHVRDYVMEATFWIPQNIVEELLIIGYYFCLPSD
jgi:hypothetical protein